jgi:hypothetical protein
MSQKSPPETSGKSEAPVMNNGTDAHVELRSSTELRLRENRAVIVPRLIRLRDAPRYLGMDKNRFNREVRRFLTEIRIGTQGVAFDRLEMEAAADDYKSRNGRSAAERSKPWDNQRRPVSSSVVGSGISIRSSEEQEFAKALAQVTGEEQKSC